MSERWGAIEGGGTKFVCAIGEDPRAPERTTRIETRTPDETLGAVIDFFRGESVDAIGLGTFGPLELDPRAGRAYGGTLATPKRGWDHVPLRARLEDALAVPVRVDTDVNAACLGELEHGALRGCSDALYVTVGTGVGMGLVVNGTPLHGLLHPEAGHLAVPQIEGDTFAGACRFHGRCLEGIASGPAIAARLGVAAESLARDAPVWELVAEALGAALAQCVLVASPERIVLGGGVMRDGFLLPRVRRALRERLGGYVQRAVIDGDAYVVSPALGARAGLVGAFVLAQRSAPPLLHSRAP